MVTPNKSRNKGMEGFAKDSRFARHYMRLEPGVEDSTITLNSALSSARSKAHPTPTATRIPVLRAPFLPGYSFLTAAQLFRVLDRTILAAQGRRETSWNLPFPEQSSNKRSRYLSDRLCTYADASLWSYPALFS